MNDCVCVCVCVCLCILQGRHHYQDFKQDTSLVGKKIRKKYRT
jgi:hypothetical protein